MTLLLETMQALKKAGKDPSDVLWVRLKGESYCSWDEFAAVAGFEYDSGYGGNEIASILMIVGDDWWLERGEYDGSEWWDFKTKPSKPANHRIPDEEWLHYAFKDYGLDDEV